MRAFIITQDAFVHASFRRA